MTRALLLLLGVAALSGRLPATAQSTYVAASKSGIDTIAQLAGVPAQARLQSNPFESDPTAALAGRKLFDRHCAQCHGNDATGSKKAPSLRGEQAQNAAPGTLFWVLTNGRVRKGMPIWSKLPEAQRWQIVTYLKSLNAMASR